MGAIISRKGIPCGHFGTLLAYWLILSHLGSHMGPLQNPAHEDVNHGITSLLNSAMRFLKLQMDFQSIIKSSRILGGKIPKPKDRTTGIRRKHSAGTGPGDRNLGRNIPSHSAPNTGIWRNHSASSVHTNSENEMFCCLGEYTMGEDTDFLDHRAKIPSGQQQWLNLTAPLRH